jgi:Acetyltransferases
MNQLIMIRPQIPVKPCQLDGYKIVAHDDSMIDDWIEISEELTNGKYTREQFIERMYDDPTVKRIFYTADAVTGKLLCTTSAQIAPDGEHGKVHMVCVHRDHKGKGLSRPVCTAVLEYLYSEGVKVIELSTDDFRIPAVSLYISLGFLPFLYEDDMYERWVKLYNTLGIEEMTAYNINRETEKYKL